MDSVSDGFETSTFESELQSSNREDLYGNMTDVNTTVVSKGPSRKELLFVYQQYIDNMSLTPVAFWILICLYCVLIVVGSTGNLFVVISVARKATMRTARNMFILNLAISDLLLCLVTAPLTVMEVVCKHWPLVRWVFICRIIGVLQGISVFVSTITITAIALDRYQVIVYPTTKSLQVTGSVGVIAFIWVLALFLVSPLYFYRDLKTFNMKLKGLETISFCREDWPIEHGRAYYSAFSLIVQYIIPIIIVSTAYQRIYCKLKNRHISANLGLEVNKENERGRKLRKTNSLLISIAVVYGVSWLPLNMLNLFADIYGNIFTQQTFLLIFSFCHMMGMSSACSNPILYGWLNDNFRKEFKEILSCCKKPRHRLLLNQNRTSQNKTLNAQLETTNLNKKSLDDVTQMPIVGTDNECAILAR